MIPRFKGKNTRDVETLIVVMDALLSLLYKKEVLTHKELQDEITRRAEEEA
jgi:hypothetical protein